MEKQLDLDQEERSVNSASGQGWLRSAPERTGNGCKLDLNEIEISKDNGKVK